MNPYRTYLYILIPGLLWLSGAPLAYAKITSDKITTASFTTLTKAQAETEPSHPCVPLKKSMQDIRTASMNLYVQLNQAPVNLANTLKEWEQKLTPWEGDTVEVPAGYFLFMIQATQKMGLEITTLEDNAFVLADQLDAITDKFNACHSGLNKKAQTLVDRMLDHIYASSAYLSAVNKSIGGWYGDWHKYEDPTSAVTFPKGTFSVLKKYIKMTEGGQTPDETNQKGAIQLISENSLKVLSWLDKFILELNAP